MKKDWTFVLELNKETTDLVDQQKASMDACKKIVNEVLKHWETVQIQEAITWRELAREFKLDLDKNHYRIVGSELQSRPSIQKTFEDIYQKDELQRAIKNIVANALRGEK